MESEIKDEHVPKFQLVSTLKYKVDNKKTLVCVGTRTGVVIRTYTGRSKGPVNDLQKFRSKRKIQRTNRITNGVETR